MLVVFYVDDVQVLYHKKNQKEAQEVIDRLKSAYEIRDLGDVKWFLGVRIVRDRAARKLWLLYDTYL